MKNKTKRKQFRSIIGVDLGDKKHQICVTDKDGNILKEFSIPNHCKHLEKLIDEYPNALIGLEVGTHSTWISRLLTAKGAEVIVANARKLRAIYTNVRKCDRLDAQMLAKLVRVDRSLLHPVQHGSEQSQRDMLSIKLRDTLVRQRVNIINSTRGTLKSLGIRLPSSSSPSFAKSARNALKQHPEILSTIDPCLHVLDGLSARIHELDKEIEETAKSKYPQTERLQQIAGIGPITSLCFVLTIDDPWRFSDPRDVGGYLGLIPRRDQSGDTDKQLPISKAGNKYLRSLLVQCSQYILGHFGPDCDLREHGLKLAARGGKAAKKKAVIAVARKLAVLMLALWQNNGDYEPLKNKPPKAA